MLRGKRRLVFSAVGRGGRCPIRADCLHVGEVEAAFTIHTDQGEVDIKFALPGGTPRSLPLHRAPWAYVDGLIVYLTRIDPYPVVGELRRDAIKALRRPGTISGRSEETVAALVVRACPETPEW